MNPKDSKRFKRFKKIQKDSKRFKKISMIASIIAKLLTVVASWPKKLIAPPPHPPDFKELDAPSLLGRLKTQWPKATVTLKCKYSTISLSYKIKFNFRKFIFWFRVRVGHS